ncbi:hypothetical protein PTSG_07259 [Salpingoeca rosetta]|uniref:Uncharacterized protein n=1 Tax=Salpingoeca rosetta (strain ATCC 50818 / BSB-021) TaxID=946362 RepID=F2UEI4_SALR5|nr:uncharacterized protein PTSG_07259 [Salpingoeca rosetta]EGD75034.1 hypothetical protein PTSG_07259 [Salpingoeca rosetta]|eukprot:XP_004992678.1 hypothetical protein PTSG_07259 [Salpingoeca rosetta]
MMTGGGGGGDGRKKDGGALAAAVFGDAPRQPSTDIHSSWKTETSLEDANTQTPAIITSDNAVQSTEMVDSEIQTEDMDEPDDRYQPIADGDDDAAAPIASFLERIEAAVSRQLDLNARSTAFEGFEFASHGLRESKITHTLKNLALSAEMQAVSAAFNRTGSVVAVAYGLADKQEWWTATSHICTWNLDGIRCNPNKPDKAMELESCATCLSYHTSDISLLAAGMLNGEVVVLDTSQDEGQELVCVSPFVADSHSEPVADIAWLRHHGDKSELVTVSGDGSIILWLYNHMGSLSLAKRVCVNVLDIPAYLRPSDAGAQQVELGVTCVAGKSAVQGRQLYLGTETGCVCRVPVTSARAPVVGNATDFAYRPHLGPVHAIAHSPHLDNVFATCGTDGKIHIYHQLQSHPLVTLDPQRAALLSVVFHPSRPAVIMAAAADGALVAYDLLKSTTQPTDVLDGGKDDDNTSPPAIRKLAINARRPGTLAAACDDGSVKVWALGAHLRETVPGEQHRMVQWVADLFSNA